LTTGSPEERNAAEAPRREEAADRKANNSYLKGVILSDMRLATLLFFTVALLAGPAPQTQNQNLIGPGDVLVLKLVSKGTYRPEGGGPKVALLSISKVVTVTPDGKLRLPMRPGMKSSEDIRVGGLDLGEAARRLEAEDRYYHVVVERGTVDRLLRQ
jgi:protein involved in polysaccharide export with SLBB domain